LFPSQVSQLTAEQIELIRAGEDRKVEKDIGKNNFGSQISCESISPPFLNYLNDPSQSTSQQQLAPQAISPL